MTDLWSARLDDPDSNIIHLDERDIDSLRERIVSDFDHLFKALSKRKDGRQRSELRLRYSAVPHFGTTDEKGTSIILSEFWQLSSSVICHQPACPIQRMITTGLIHHPIRPRFTGSLYKRSVNNEVFELRCAEMSDCPKLMDWHNSPRVSAFWNEEGDLSHHEAYLRRQLDDGHVTPVVGLINGERFGYFELYYAKEDNIGSYADAGNWDVGFHALIGEQAFRGPERVKVWIQSITHLLFLNDPRTHRVMLEPRVDNEKFIAYLQKYGFNREKDFNFPHKRAALMVITRERFFEVMYGPTYQASSSSI